MRLRLLQLLQYLIPIVLGLMLGASATVPISRLVLDHTLTTTGVLIPSGLPLPGCMLTLAAILMLLTGQSAVFCLNRWWPVVFLPSVGMLLASLFTERIFCKYSPELAAEEREEPEE